MIYAQANVKHLHRLISEIEIWARSVGLTFLGVYGDVKDKRYLAAKKFLAIRCFDPIGGLVYWYDLNHYLANKEQQLIVVTDNFLDLPALSHIHFFQHPALWGVNYTLVEDWPVNERSVQMNPRKKFNCFINRVDPVRQTWLYFLHQHDLIDQGYVSCNLYQLDGKPTGLPLFDHNHSQYELYRLPHFHTAYESLRLRVPFRNFDDAQGLYRTILDTKYSLVLDTAAAEDDISTWFISEKVYRSLITPTVDLLFVQKGCCDKIKKLGFAVSNLNLVHDTMAWQDRQQYLLKLLITDSIEWHPLELEEKCQHNLALLGELWQHRNHLVTDLNEFFYSI